VWRSGVEAHTHPDRTLGERRLRLSGRLQRTGRGWKGDEEGVALGAHLDPPVAGEGLAHKTAVLGQGLRVCLGPQLVQEPRRALDVGEEERHRASRKVVSDHFMAKIVARPLESQSQLAWSVECRRWGSGFVTDE
jgi:hypothetical protein